MKRASIKSRILSCNENFNSLFRTKETSVQQLYFTQQIETRTSKSFQFVQFFIRRKESHHIWQKERDLCLQFSAAEWMAEEEFTCHLPGMRLLGLKRFARNCQASLVCVHLSREDQMIMFCRLRVNNGSDPGACKSRPQADCEIRAKESRATFSR